MACLRKVLKKRLKPRPANIIPFRKPDPVLDAALDGLTEAAVIYCEVSCGGCDLSRKWRAARGI